MIARILFFTLFIISIVTPKQANIPHSSVDLSAASLFHLRPSSCDPVFESPALYLHFFMM